MPKYFKKVTVLKLKFKSICSMVLCFSLLFCCAACGGAGDKSSTATSSKEASTAASSNVSSSKAPVSSGLTPGQIAAASRAESNAYIQKTKIHIMPMGDSLTDGFEHNQMGAYRSFLNDMIKADNNNYRFVGAHDWENRLIKDGNVMHSGWGGIDVPGLKGKLEEIEANAKPAPDVILLMIGRNDVTAGKSAEKTVENIDTMLVNELYTLYPNTTILLASPPPIVSGSGINTTEPGVTTYRDAYKAYVEKKKGEGCKIEFVDMGVESVGLTYDDFKDDAGKVDGVHPYINGFTKIAATWYKTLKPVMEQIVKDKANS